MATAASKPAESAPVASTPKPEDVKYKLVIPTIPHGQYTPGQLAWVEESTADEWVAMGWATKVLRKDAEDAPPAP